MAYGNPTYEEKWQVVACGETRLVQPGPAHPAWQRRHY